MPYVQSITDVLTDHLGWNRARLKLIARFKAAMLKLQTANLWKIAVALKAGVQIRSNYRRIQRFLAGYDVDFAELGRLLVKLLPESEPHVVVIDRTEWHFGSTPVNILAVGIAHRGVAFPIAWKVLPKGGSSEASEQIDVLERFLGVVDPSSVEAVVADREFISIEWLCRLQERDIPFVIRLRSDRQVGLAPDGPFLPARMFARRFSPQTEGVLEGSRVLSGTDGKQAEVRVVARRIGSFDDEDPFLILATWRYAPEKATSLYSRRWEIETMFAALKSRGYDLEETCVTDPDRVENLIGLLALAFAWTHLVGEKRAMRHGPPSEKVHGRRQRSLFRYGLDLLQCILTTPRPQRQAFFTCLTGLRSPTAFLSRT